MVAIEAQVRDVPLRRNWRFQTLWLGSTSAGLGLETAEIAYPLIILAMTGSPALAGAFGFVQLLAMVAGGLPAGALLDRADRRRTLLAAELVRAVAAASVAVALATGRLTVAHVMVAGAVLGAGAAFGGAARILALRAVVPPDQLTAALTRNEVRDAATTLLGPPLGGLLYAVGRVLPFLASALGLAASFCCALAVRFPSPQPASSAAAADTEPRHDALAGIRLLLGRPLLRTTLASLGVVNVAGTAVPLLVIVLVGHDPGSARTVGLIMGVAAVGGLLGSALIGYLHRRLRPGQLLVAVTGLIGTMFASLALPVGPVWIAVALCLAFLGIPAVKVLLDVLIFRQVPDELRGRAITATMTLLTLGMPAGALVGGVLLQLAGPAVTAAALGGAVALAAAAAWANPQVRAARWPAG